jgi:hypothetical protein
VTQLLSTRLQEFAVQGLPSSQCASAVQQPASPSYRHRLPWHRSVVQALSSWQSPGTLQQPAIGNVMQVPVAVSHGSVVHAPETSYLVDKIRGINLCSGTRMPKNASLSLAEIQTIVDWVAEGALND